MEKVSKVFSILGFFVSLLSLMMPTALLFFSAYSNSSLKLGLAMSIAYFLVSIVSIVLAILSKKFATKIKKYHFKRFVMIIATFAILVNSFLAEISVFGAYTELTANVIYCLAASISVFIVTLCIVLYVFAGKNNKAIRKKYNKKSKKKNGTVTKPAHERNLIYR